MLEVQNFRSSIWSHATEHNRQAQWITEEKKTRKIRENDIYVYTSHATNNNCTRRCQNSNSSDT